MASRRISGTRSSSGLRHELIDLSHHLRQERLYVQNEKTQLQDLNEKVKSTSEQLSHTAWLAHRQREILDNLIFAPRASPNECLPTFVCLRANLLEQTSFQDAYKHLSHQEMLYAEFLQTLRLKPKLLATCLALADHTVSQEKMMGIVSTVFGGFYGSCILPEDEKILLRLLLHLMKLQLSHSSNPRKLLRQGNCAFSRLYKAFSEELFSAKLFLTSALHDPILKLLSDDEVFLDVDPAKVVIRFPPAEREKRFGKETQGTEYAKRVKQHRDFICSKLEALTNNFIRGIKENLHCFPPSLARLLKAMYNMLMAQKVEPRLVNAVCVDVLFSLFICPAIVDPNPVGIIDAPISYVARSNLMQVAQILQVLALWKWEEIDPRLMDLYSRFDKETLASVLETMLDPGAEAYSMFNTNSDEFDFDMELSILDHDRNNTVDRNAETSNSSNVAGDAIGYGLSHHSTRLSRIALLMTMTELEEVIQMLRSVQHHVDISEIEGNELNAILDPLPENLPKPRRLPSSAESELPLRKLNSSASSSKDGGGGENSALAAMIAKRQVLSNKLSTAVNAAVKRSSSASTPSTPGSDEVMPNDLSSPSMITGNNESGASLESLDESALLQQCEPDLVLVVPLPDQGQMAELPGFLSEEHVISRSRQASRVVRMNLANLPGGEDVGDQGGLGQGTVRRNSATVNSEENSSLMSVGPSGEKRTRFSLSHDEGSIGNTSDNLEAISEAASNHSVASSLEDEPDNPDAEDQINDNLSDMVSANVSGRGTPNVSGRDTPSSQVTEDGADDSQNRQPRNEDNDVPGIHRDDHRGAAGAIGNHHPQIAIENSDQNHRGGPPETMEENNSLHNHRMRQRGRKSGEPDLDEKFGKFEIKPPLHSRGRLINTSNVVGGGLPQSGSNPLELQGDETISMVSDTWSTDVLASDTETDQERGSGSRRYRMHVRLPDELAGLAGVDHRQLSAGGTSSNQGMVGVASSSIASSSAANLLDVAETASEAWSIDVLASDTESLRLGELDNEDTGSVARSDDTTRSEPAELLLAMESSANIKGRFAGDGGTRPSRADVVEQWARQSSGHAQRLSSSIQRRGSDSLGSRPIEGSILKRPHVIPESNASDGDAATGGIVSSTTSNSSSMQRLLSHPSAASIASSTESSAGDSAGSNKESSKSTTQPGLTSAGAAISNSSSVEIEVASASSNVQSGAGTSQTALPKKSTLSMSNTGAIPKSISFDKTVVMNSRHSKDESSPVSSSSEFDQANSRGLVELKADLDQSGSSSQRMQQKMDKSFFKSWKLPKIGRSHRGGAASAAGGPNYKNLENRGGGGSQPSTDFLTGTNGNEEQVILPEEGILVPNRCNEEEEVTADDILAKYRTVKTRDGGELSSSNEVILSAPFEGNPSGDASDLVDGPEPEMDDFDDRLVIDPHNLEVSFAFQDAKRKLRMMLSEADLSLLSTTSFIPCSNSNTSSSSSATSSSVSHRDLKVTNDLVALLKVQLAEAHNLQDRNLVAQLHETLRCLSLFDNEGCRKLVRSLKEDYKRRSPYLAYLVKCRQGLLSTLAHQRRLLSRMEADRRVCSSHQLNVCSRLFLEKREKQILNFVNNFKDSKASDEKIALMERFLSSLWSQLESDTSVTLLTSSASTEIQMDLCRVAVERAVVSHIYYAAMFPNGEADACRDNVLTDHIRKLAGEITPNHRDLRIGRHFQYESPWPSAQAELGQLAAFKTPKDKVACVVRCCQTIMNLLSLSQAKSSVPAADDFLPVLVFVVVKANPANLLSTVQYVESFYGNRLGGEDHYWWMQFVAAIEFIKTMDYST